ncbi:DNA-binding protein [Bacillus cereus]|nr:DNA-binding protein [Bacillus cereus]
MQRKIRIPDKEWDQLVRKAKKPSEKVRELVSEYNSGDILNNIIGVQEASTLWGISNKTIILLCEQMILKSKKIDGVWIIYKNQSLPEDY